MLKRYQVLFPDWLEEYIKMGVEAYGFSFSELIRLEVCFSILTQIPILHPEYKPSINLQDIFKAINQAATESPDKKKYAGIVSQIYFETRKAIEYRKQKQEKISKK